MLIEIIKCLFMGIGVGIDAFLRILPLYNQLSSIREQLIAYALGVPEIIISIIFLFPTIFAISKKIIKAVLH